MQENHKTLNINEIETHLLLGKISYFNSIDSTNHWLLKNGQHADICISEKQTSGKGRRGKQWVSPDSGNIYFSLCWQFNEPLKHTSLLGLEIGIAIAESLKKVGLNNHGIKWPNDILWQQKKLGGILLETTNQSGSIVIGIGLNIELPNELRKAIDQPNISISEIMPIEEGFREQLLITLIQQLHQQLSAFPARTFFDFIKSWNKWDILQNQEVSFTHQNELIIGKVTGLDRHGRIGVVSNETINYFSSADIKIRKHHECIAN